MEFCHFGRIGYNRINNNANNPAKNSGYQLQENAEANYGGYRHIMQRIAIIDIGSNSARLVISHIYKSGAYNMVFNQKEMLRLAQKTESDGLLSKEEYDTLSDRFEKGKELIRTYNTAGFLDEEKLSSIKALKSLYVTDRETNEKVELLTDDELHEMMIAKGTLTAEERKIIEMHAVYTDRILSKISFQDDFKLVRVFAAAHHEYLDGSGYPNGLTAKDLPLEVRIMTIADIYDSLTADDRPYKKAVPVQKALSILTSMADEGKLDKTLTKQFCDYIYEATSKEPN